MALIRPLRAVRPRPELAAKVAALPYDVMDRSEAARLAAGNPLSFLHVSRPEIDLPQLDAHADAVHARGRENLRELRRAGALMQDDSERYYVYRQQTGTSRQTGFVVCASIDDYQRGTIKQHERTRAGKEEDRFRHIDAMDANDEPVFCAWNGEPQLTDALAEIARSQPLYDFTSEDGVTHTLWSIAEPGGIQSLTERFARLPALYIADGHHRSAAASRVRELRKQNNPRHTGDEGYNFFLAVAFPADELTILPYHRLLKSLNGKRPERLLEQLAERFTVSELTGPCQPTRRHEFGMFLGGSWYRLNLRKPPPELDTIANLDVSILHEQLLTPLLGVTDPSLDPNLSFVGGVRGAAELERRVRSGEHAIAFALFPTSVREVISVADAGGIMPPKSTWFEPKLRSGLFVHLLE